MEIAHAIGASISTKNHARASSCIITGIRNIEDSREGDLSFINNRKYHNLLKDAKCSACIIAKGVELDVNPQIILIEAEDSYFAYSKAINFLYSEIKSTSIDNISPKAKIHNSVKIGRNVVIEDDVEILEGAEIDHNSVIKYGVKIGANCKIGSSSYLSFCEIGDGSIIHSGVRIGTDGFGFATFKGTHHKILHVGSVIIGKNVEIGANSTIDRGSIKDTIIGDGTIIDNLVQIGHNVEIGKGCIIVAQVGIAGSTKLGDYVVIGGQAGLAGHLKIANFVQIAGKSGVISDIETEKQIVGGYPSQPIRDWHKQTILMKKMLADKK
jgi:UDP-3-O-[3-hydroxymyristoyl] glucosamine N-acyltransferase